MTAWFTGKQKAQRERKAEDPLAHGLMRQDVIHQQGGAVGHSSRPAAGAKGAAFTTIRHQLLIMASLTAGLPAEAIAGPT